MLRDNTKKRDASKLAEVIAAKSPASTEVSDYVPPPLVDVQAQFENKRRPMPSEVNQDVEREISTATVDRLKYEIEADTHRGPEGASAVATEAAHLETVRRIKVSLAKSPNQIESREAADARNARAHIENLDLIKAEMARSIHTEDYSG